MDESRMQVQQSPWSRWPRTPGLPAYGLAPRTAALTERLTEHPPVAKNPNVNYFTLSPGPSRFRLNYAGRNGRALQRGVQLLIS